MQLVVTKVYAPIICLVLNEAKFVSIKHMMRQIFVLVFITLFCTYLKNYWNELENKFQNKVCEIYFGVFYFFWENSCLPRRVWKKTICGIISSIVWYRSCLLTLLLPYRKKLSRLNAVSLIPEDIYHQELYHKIFHLKKPCLKKWDVSCTDTTAIVCRYLRINSAHIKSTKIWVISGVSNHHKTGQSATKCFSQFSNNSCCVSKHNRYCNPKPITLWGLPKEE